MPCEVFAGVAIAVFINRAEVANIWGIGDVDSSGGCVDRTASRNS
jgi:hypothetical protein